MGKGRKVTQNTVLVWKTSLVFIVNADLLTVADAKVQF